VALLAMITWSFAQRWGVLSASPFPLGVDGYFYPIQLRSLLETGELQYPASPLAFWLLAPFAAATDPITGAKLGAAVLGALIALPAYGVGTHLGRRDDPRAERDHDGRGPGLVAAAIAVGSSGSMYLTIEFVKNGIGLTVALTALWLVLRCTEKQTRGRVVAAMAGVIAAVLAHKMAAAIVIGIAIPTAALEAHRRGVFRARGLLVAAIAAAAIGALVVVGMLAPRRFLSPDDLVLFERLFTSAPEWELPVLGDGRLILSHEPLLAAIVALGAGVLLVVERRRFEVAAWAIVGLALFIGLPWLDVGSPQGLGMRLRIVAFVPLALCAAIVLRVALPWIIRDKAQRLGACAAIAGAAIAIRVGGEPRTEGIVLAIPGFVTGASALAGRIPDGDVAIVPERHVAFMVAWYARASISIRPERVEPKRRWRVLPLAFIRRTSPALDRALVDVRDRAPVIGLDPRHPNGLVLVPEQTWRVVLEMVPEAERRVLERWPTI
jgi:hypothetical protein